MFSTPETSVHVRAKNREISPLERKRKVTGERIWRKGEFEDENGRPCETRRPPIHTDGVQLGPHVPPTSPHRDQQHYVCCRKKTPHRRVWSVRWLTRRHSVLRELDVEPDPVQRHVTSVPPCAARHRLWYRAARTTASWRRCSGLSLLQPPWRRRQRGRSWPVM